MSEPAPTSCFHMTEELWERPPAKVTYRLRGTDLFSESGRDISSGSPPRSSSDAEALLSRNPDLGAYILMSNCNALEALIQVVKANHSVLFSAMVAISCSSTLLLLSTKINTPESSETFKALVARFHRAVRYGSVRLGVLRFAFPLPKVGRVRT